MGASRPEVSRELKMDCGCYYMYSPDRFVRGERRFTCAHRRVWRISAVRSEITYTARDVTPVEDEETG